MNEHREIWEFAGFRFDPGSDTLWHGGDPVPLAPKPLELLKLLVSRNGEIVSKQEIFDTVWAGTYVEEGVLTQNIYTLRQALGKDAGGKQLIENIARRGYRLNAPVTRTGGPRDEIASNAPAEPAFSRSFPFTILALILLGATALSAAVYFGFRTPGESGPERSGIEIKFTRLTDKGDVTHLAISPDGRQAAYTQGVDLRIRDLGVDNERRIEIGGSSKLGCVQFSADGGSIYFGTVRRSDEKGTISRVPTTGGTAEVVAADVWTCFSISPDGTELAFVRKNPEQNGQVLIRKNLADGRETTAASIKLPEEFYWNNYPAWSADGRRIALVAVTQTEHISRIVVIEDGRETSFRPAHFRNIEQVVWNAAGDGLIASGNDGTNFQIWRISLADGSARRITNDLNSYLGIAVSQDRKHLISRQRVYYSNIWVGSKDNLNDLRQVTDGTSRNDGLNGMAWLDEERLVYTSNDQRIRDWNLWLLNTGDGSRKKLTHDTDVQNDFPTVSRDGQFIYFASDRSGQQRIWRIRPEGGDMAQVTFGEDEAHLFPQVSPDGTQLYFITKSGRTSSIGRAWLTERAVKELSDRGPFVPGNLLAISPDGKYIAFQDIGGQTPGDEPLPVLKIAILSTVDPNDARTIEVNSLRHEVQWSRNGRAIDVIVGDVKQAALFRRPLSDAEPPTQLTEMSGATLFRFAWSPSGEKIAVARGQLLRDVILLTDIDP